MPKTKSRIHRNEYGEIIHCKNIDCLSKNLVKAGFSINRLGKRQKYICKDCGVKFIPNSKPGRPRLNPEAPLTNQEKQQRFREKHNN